MYNPKCVVCGKPVTWQFYVCSDCEAEWGKRKDERPEWLTYLINEERMTRYHIENGADVVGWNDSDENYSYSIDFETLITHKFYYAGFQIEDSDGTIELQDSDWEAVYSWSW